jgi:hypothetical protein
MRANDRFRGDISGPGGSPGAETVMLATQWVAGEWR